MGAISPTSGYISLADEIRKEKFNFAKCVVKASLMPLLSASTGVAFFLAALFQVPLTLFLLASGLFVLSVATNVIWAPHFIDPIKVSLEKIVRSKLGAVDGHTLYPPISWISL